MLDTYTPLLESRLEDLKIIYSTKGKEFSRLLENHLHYAGTLPVLPVSQVQRQIESAPKVTLLNRGRAKIEVFALNRLSILSPLSGETARLVKVGIFPRRERISRFARGSAWNWSETGVVLLDSKIMFVKGDLSPVKHLLNALNESTLDGQIILPLGSEIFVDLSGAIAFYDTSIPVGEDYALRIVSQFDESYILALPTETDLNEWLAAINYLATIISSHSPPQDDSASITPAMSRRRAGTMAPPAGRPVPLRAVSSTVELRGRSKSEQPSLTQTYPVQDKLAMYAAWQRDLEAKLPLQKVSVDSLLRQARGLLIQTPLQDKTRLGVLNALERVMKRLKASRIELESGVAYIAILSHTLDMMVENKIRFVEKDGGNGEEQFQLPMLGFGEEMREDKTEKLPSGTSLYGNLMMSEEGDLGVPVRRIGTPSKSIPPSPNQSPVTKSVIQRTPPRQAFLDAVVSEDKWEQDTPAEPRVESLMDPRNLGLEKSESAPGSLDTIRWIPYSLRAENISDMQRADSAQMVKEAGF